MARQQVVFGHGNARTVPAIEQHNERNEQYLRGVDEEIRVR
jgi:hypothetical protein